MDIGQLLSTAGFATDAHAREGAQVQLSTLAGQNFPEYVQLIAQELAKQSNQLETRMLAALELKNQLVAKTPRAQQQFIERYLALDPELRAGLQEVSLQTLSAPEAISRAGAQLIAAIAGIDLPRNQWPTLPKLLIEATKPGQPVSTKKACLQAIGFICEAGDAGDHGLVSQMDSLLTATIQGASASEESTQVRLAAINALVNSLVFIRANFERENERNIIMQVVCESTQAKDSDLQAAGFGALGRIMAEYYQYMGPYMEQALFALTLEGMRSGEENVVCMAIEFWSTVSEEENALQEGAAMGTAEFPSSGFARAALGVILPTLLSLLVRSEDVDDDEWSSTMAAGACVQLLAQNVKDDIVEPTLQYISANIQSGDWAHREAAVMAFGSILDGPNPQKLAELISQALEPLLALMSDSSESVRDTVAWCLGRIAQLVASAINQHNLPQIISVLIKGISDKPKVATHCCWTIINLAQNIAVVPGEETIMSGYYTDLVTALVASSDRSDNEYSSRTSAYEALSTLTLSAPNTALQLILSMSGLVISRLAQSLELQKQVVSVDDGINVSELQTNLLGLLTNIIRRVDKEVVPAADNLMTLLLQFLQNRMPNSVVDEDVFMAVGAVAGALDDQFARFVPAFMPFVIQALQEPEFPACRTAVGLVADISHSIGSDIAAYSEQVMAAFVAILQSDDAQRDMKPVVLSCIGDIAASIGPQFGPYLNTTFQLLKAGGELQITNETSYDMYEYILSLREAILDAYVGLLAGFRDSASTIGEYIESIFQFLHGASQGGELLHAESALRSAVGIVGDIASMYPQGQFKQFYTNQWVTDLIKSAKDRSLGPQTRETAKWAREQQKLQLQL